MKLSPDLFLSIRLALRSGFAQLGFGVVVAVAVVAALAAQFSARQPATVALDIGFSFIRLALPLVAIILTQELLGREFERRYFLNSLTYPRARQVFLLGRYGAILSLLLVLLVAMACVLAVVVTLVARDYAQGSPVGLGLPYLTTLLFIWVDTIVIVAFAVCLAMMAATPGFMLVGSLGFVLIARSYGAIVELLALGGDLVTRFANQETYRKSLSLLDYVLPDLGSLDVRMVSLYNQMSLLPADWPWRIGAALCYSVALLAISAWILRQREFR